MSTFAVGSASAVLVASYRGQNRSFGVAGGGRVTASRPMALPVATPGAGSTSAKQSARGTNWLPPTMQPIGYVEMKQPDGSSQRMPVMIDSQWYLGFDEVFQRRLSGVNGPSVADVGVAANAAVMAVSAVTTTVALVSQQSDAAAAAATAVRDVLISADVPGAPQIPSVPTTNKPTQNNL